MGLLWDTFVFDSFVLPNSEPREFEFNQFNDMSQIGSFS